MKIKKIIKKTAGWALKGLAVFAIPALFPASVGMEVRAGWIGAVLVWMFMGRIMKDNSPVEQ